MSSNVAPQYNRLYQQENLLEFFLFLTNEARSNREFLFSSKPIIFKHTLLDV